MTLREAAAAFTMLVAAGLVLVTALLVAVKVLRSRRERHRARIRTAMRQSVLAALEDDDRTLELHGRVGRVTQEVVVSMLGQVRGSDRERLAALLEKGGAIQRAEVALGSRLPARRQHAAELLGAAGYAPAVPRLVDRLHDHDSVVRMAAARALGKIGSPEAVAPLTASLSDHSVPANTVSMAIMRIGPGGAPALRPALRSPSTRVRATAAELIGVFGDTESVAEIEDLLEDPDPLVVTGAARALGRFGSPSSVRPLLARLSSMLAPTTQELDEDSAVSIVSALGRIGDRSCIPVLIQCEAHPYRLKRAAEEALAPMGRRREDRRRTRSSGSGSTEPAEMTAAATADAGGVR